MQRETHPGVVQWLQSHLAYRIREFLTKIIFQDTLDPPRRGKIVHKNPQKLNNHTCTNEFIV